MDIKKIKKEFKKDLLENVNLKNYTTMKVGGPADFFYTAKKIEDLIKIIMLARESGVPFLVIGGGSNIIVSDDGFRGLIILNRTSEIVFLADKAQVICDSGISLMRLVMESANRDLGGLEPLYGIPGTLGGAIYGNAGANGVEICSLIRYLTLLTPENKIVRVKSDWLMPSYRSTKLKEKNQKKKSGYILLSARLQLVRHKKEEILRQIQLYKKTREDNQPYDLPSAGSIFKNPKPVNIKDKVDNKKESEKTYSAGYILDSVGAKKLKVGGAEVSKKHANFVVNKKDASANDVINLIYQMKTLAHDKWGVDLKEEVEYI
jgi:UDP-N-acetylmuramate dehydrogenase